MGGTSECIVRCRKKLPARQQTIGGCSSVGLTKFAENTTGNGRTKPWGRKRQLLAITHRRATIQHGSGNQSMAEACRCGVWDYEVHFPGSMSLCFSVKPSRASA